ncbi:UDP-N-acetylmuramoylalanine--D-glutamate ligase [Sphingorhabdus lutea]|uniref:UDP-N-acetylmuramoylalanine--D-glutamate ligase n=1 Tax=Sphingorhabdus lutea TaxID=1913578 RepID=A0A1L3JD31_9SPHN|nr:UDP-N-acetylmuramoyl-L-alanine--D-glutamate ligase [Sphingorhabdus lutea]APG62973.1 UDP-N-acetylmuramoylalanine--D-glutamate ligase [Sphingorhabdus lutea]
MIISRAFAGKKYIVLGLARTGYATVKSLIASGAHVTAWDNRSEARKMVEDIATLADPMEMDLAGYDALILSPGIALNTHPIVGRANAANVPILGDIELFAMARHELPPHRVVGITGTNGKSTTTALVHHILKNAAIPTRMGGNIGLPILGQDALPAGGVYVLELSSYQIDLTQNLACEFALLLNLTPDHLDRYDGFEGYSRSKRRLFEMQHSNGQAIFCGDDAISLKMAQDNYPDETQESKISAQKQIVYAVDIAHFDHSISINGPHNAQNISGAVAICRGLGLNDKVIEAGLKTYKGLPHRLEYIGEIDGVSYINDSKATNMASAAPALAAFHNVHWIIGGVAKDYDISAALPFMDHVKAIYTIGESGAEYHKMFSPHAKVEQCEMLIMAVERAASMAEKGDNILLSPACASFDQFRDFEARGECFKMAVRAISEQRDVNG